MHRRIARYDSAGKWPILRMFCQFCCAGVVNDVETDLGKGVSLTLLLLEHVIVCLMLKPLRSQDWFEMRA